MSEARWTFYDPQSGPQTMGLYHGDKSGHVVVYHNSNVIIVDFQILESKTYSIQFNDCLITLGIEKEGHTYDYSFERKPLYEEQTIVDRVMNYFFPSRRLAS